jgi:hypothetical protein
MQVPQGSCNVDLGFPELFLDGRHVASGLQINNVMGEARSPAAIHRCLSQSCTSFHRDNGGARRIFLELHKLRAASEPRP